RQLRAVPADSPRPARSPLDPGSRLNGLTLDHRARDDRNEHRRGHSHRGDEPTRRARLDALGRALDSSREAVERNLPLELRLFLLHAFDAGAAVTAWFQMPLELARPDPLKLARPPAA